MSFIGPAFKGLAGGLGGLFGGGGNLLGGMGPLGSMFGSLMGLNNGSASNGALLGKFDIDMQAELENMLAQELRQMKENRQMDELKHKGKLHSDAGAIAQ
jgi:hypothetical protein